MSAGIPADSLVRKDRIILLSSAGCLAALSWLSLARAHSTPDPTHDPLLAPHAHPSGPEGFALAFLMWMVMMVAMMLPPVMPWILLFASTSRRKHADTGPYLPTALFVSGYFSIWALYSVVAALVQVVLQQRALLQMADLRAASAAGAALLLTAGVFQFTPLKSACLKHCRTPLGFFLSQWRNGPAGAVRMGFRHGLYCLGCCWALMALCFALGVMNLLWMAVLTLVLCLEKIAPGGRQLGRFFGLLLAAWGLWLLASS